MKIMAVSFDMDGTLYPYFMMYVTGFKLFLQYPKFTFHFNRIRKQIRKVRHIKDFRQKQAELLANRMKIDPVRAMKLIEKIIYGKWIDSFKGIRPFPYLIQVLEKIRELKLKLALLSDYPVERKLKFLGLSDFWDLKFSAEEVHNLKPNPECFKELSKRLNIPSDNILYVGDTYHYDIVGAHNIGMRTAHFTKRAVENSIADITFSDYRDFYSILLKKIN